MNKNTLQHRPWRQSLALRVMKFLSWKLDLNHPEVNSYVMIGAPHTSNWDLIFFLLYIYAAGIQMRWIGKDTLFRGPLGPFFRCLGGIPVNRRTNNDFVSQMVTVFQQNKDLVVAISPEGTRSKSNYWKTGFYYIALRAQVPIALGYIDYTRKIIGQGPCFYPSGDLHSDFEQIKAFYAGKAGKNPHKQGKVQLRQEDI